MSPKMPHLACSNCDICNPVLITFGRTVTKKVKNRLVPTIFTSLPLPVGGQSIVNNMYVCLSARISPTPYVQISPHFLYTLFVAIARSTDSCAIQCIVLVVWMTSYFQSSQWAKIKHNTVLLGLPGDGTSGIIYHLLTASCCYSDGSLVFTVNSLVSLVVSPPWASNTWWEMHRLLSFASNLRLSESD